MRNSLLLFFATILCSTLSAQDYLMLESGKKVLYTKMDLVEDSVEVTTYEEGVRLSFHADSVVGYCSPTSDESYYLKSKVELYNKIAPQFLERIEVGRINLYKKVSNTNGLYFYMEKDGRFENAFASTATGSKKQKKFELFSSFLEDDQESLDYINSPGFKFRHADVLKVVQYYNRRNFVPVDALDKQVHGTVILYRTKFQKIKSELKIELFGKTHDLFTNDYIKLRIPVRYASEIQVSGQYVVSKKLLAAELMDQYFEVVYDKKTKTFLFDKKVGSELQYEFYRIKKKVIDN